MAQWDKVKADIAAEWDKTMVPALSAYIAVPNQSPAYDPTWATNGLQEKAFAILIDWMLSQGVKGLTHEYTTDPGRTPFLLVEITGTTPTADCVLMYGHMDKQPPLLPWDEGLGPYIPVVRDGKLYGRGGADDGYALLSAVSSVVALQRNGIPHGRIVIVIEGGEESGSPDLTHYMQRFHARIGRVGLMICLDSGSMNYDQVWLTTSLRGICVGQLHVRMLAEGVHSGVAGGVVPDTFRIARQLLDRVEDAVSGEVKVPEAFCTIPDWVVKANEVMNTIPFREQFSTLPGVQTHSGNNADLALRNFWKPSLTVTGDNLPDAETAGNVIRTHTTLRLSLRVAPLADAETAIQAVKKVLEANPPYGAQVTFDCESAGNGCATPELVPWLATALEEGSKSAFGKTFACQGMGGGIPFIAELIKTYKDSQFLVTGVLGPKSNAHGPNEFLHIPYVKGVTYAVARIVGAHFENTPKA